MNYIMLYNVAALLFRLYIGYYFIPAGWKKMLHGQEEWLWLGQQMGNFGIHFAPVFWGLAAVIAELLGGILLLFGLYTRLASPFLAFTMLVAATMHIKNNDPWTVYIWAIAYLIGFVVLTIYGAGMYSADYWLQNNR